MGSRFRLLQQLHQRALGTPLRALSTPLLLPELLSSSGQHLSAQLVAAMEREKGVGLAAPQVGRNVRMFAAQLDEAYEHEEEEDEEETKAAAASRAPRRRKGDRSGGVRARPQASVVVNPRVLWSSPQLVTGLEGCLSLPGLVGLVPRPRSIRVSYLDGRAGAGGALVSEQELTGFRARIFLHELDHLDGVLFTDRLLDPKHLMTDEALEKRARL